MREEEFLVDEDLEGQVRIDRYISEYVGILSRSQLKARATQLFVNDKPVKLSRGVEPGDRIRLLYEEALVPDIRPEPMELEIVFENEHVLVLNKPQGQVVHPGNGNYSGTLVQGLMHYCERLRDSFPGEDYRPGIVHRLDKETSGVIVTAKTADALEHLAEQFRARRVEKRYAAIVRGTLPRRAGTISGTIRRDPVHRKRFVHVGPAPTRGSHTGQQSGGGKSAETEYRVLGSSGGYSFLELRPKTGRTHQLRVHMKSVGTPILGDPVYARRDERFPDAGLMLHAYSLDIILPGEGERRRFCAPLPERMRITLRSLRRGS